MINDEYIIREFTSNGKIISKYRNKINKEIEQYLENRFEDKDETIKERQNKRSIIEAKDMNFQRGDINFSPNLLLKTKSKLYVRVNRDKSDLVIRGNQVAV